MRNGSLRAIGLGLGLVFAVTASAQGTRTYSKKGTNADVSWQNSTEECNYVDGLHIEASETIEKTDLTRTVTRSAAIGFFGRDDCNGVTWGGSDTVPLKKSAFSTANTVTFSFDIPVQYGYYDLDQTVIRRLVGTITFTLDPDPGNVFEKTRTVTTIGNEFFLLTSRSKSVSAGANVTINASIQDPSGSPLPYRPLAYTEGYGTIGEIKDGEFSLSN